MVSYFLFIGFMICVVLIGVEVLLLFFSKGDIGMMLVFIVFALAVPFLCLPITAIVLAILHFLDQTLFHGIFDGLLVLVWKVATCVPAIFVDSEEELGYVWLGSLITSGLAFFFLPLIAKPLKVHMRPPKDKRGVQSNSESQSLEVDVLEAMRDWEPIWDEKGNRTSGHVVVDGHGRMLEVCLNGFDADGFSFGSNERQVVNDGAGRFIIVGRTDFRYGRYNNRYSRYKK